MTTGDILYHVWLDSDSPMTKGNQFLHLERPSASISSFPDFQGEKIPSGAPIRVWLHRLYPVPDFWTGTWWRHLENGESRRRRWRWWDLRRTPEWSSWMGACIQSGTICQMAGTCDKQKRQSTYNLHQQVTRHLIGIWDHHNVFLPHDPFNLQKGPILYQIFQQIFSDQSLNATVFYIQTLQMPALQRNTSCRCPSGQRNIQPHRTPKVSYRKTKNRNFFYRARSENFILIPDLLLRHGTGTGRRLYRKVMQSVVNGGLLPL